MSDAEVEAVERAAEREFDIYEQRIHGLERERDETNAQIILVQLELPSNPDLWSRAEAIEFAKTVLKGSN
ncbi:MAG: hypothetical protein V3T77_09110 [Planctomycetota bacterium]